MTYKFHLMTEPTKALEDLHEKLFSNPTAVLTQGKVQVITALGGVGKAILARLMRQGFPDESAKSRQNS